MRDDVPAPAYLSAFGPSVDGVVIKNDFRDDLLTHFLPDMQGSINVNVKRSGEAAGANRYDVMFGVVTSEALWRFSSSDIQGISVVIPKTDSVLLLYDFTTTTNSFVFQILYKTNKSILMNIVLSTGHLVKSQNS